MQVGEYTLVNEEKLHRAIHGALDRQGKEVGGLLDRLGVGSIDEIPELELLAEYDKLGGLIRKGKYKVSTGCFYDSKNGKPFKKPEVKLIFRFDGEVVEFDAEQPVPLEVQASEIVKERKQKKKIEEAVKKEKASKAKKSKKQNLEDEE